MIASGQADPRLTWGTALGVGNRPGQGGCRHRHFHRRPRGRASGVATGPGHAHRHPPEPLLGVCSQHRGDSTRSAGALRSAWTHDRRVGHVAQLGHRRDPLEACWRGSIWISKQMRRRIRVGRCDRAHNPPTGEPSLLVLHKLAELYELPYALLLEREGPGGVTFRSRIATR